MSDTYEVISAFLDDEPFDPSRLAEALGEPDGRAFLLDVLALRHLAQPKEHQAPASIEQQPPKRAPLKALLAVAAVVIALAGGYLVGQRGRVAPSEAPTATRVVDAPAVWQEVLPGRMQ